MEKLKTSSFSNAREYFFLFFLFGIFTIPAHASNCARNLGVFLVNKIRVSENNFFQKQLSGRGVQVNNLVFRVQNDSTFFQITLSNGHAQLGYIRLIDELDFQEHTTPIIDKVELSATLKGTGLGQLLYIAAAKAKFESTHKILHKSGLTTSDANRVWERLIQKGWAEEILEDGQFPVMRFKQDFLRGTHSEDALNFVYSRIE